jgi:HlyD family secretion protein
MNAWTKKRLAISIGLAVVVVLVLVGLATREPVPQVPVVAVAKEDLTASVSSNGKVEPITPHVLRAQLATFVEQVHAVAGRAVKRGQPLLTLDAIETRAELARTREELLAAEDALREARAGGRADEVAQVESDLRKTEAELNRLRHEREALTRLKARQAATQDELDQNQLVLDRAEAQWKFLLTKREDMARRAKLDVERAGLLAERSRNSLRALEEKVRSAQVVAPVDGVVYLLPFRRGDFVRVGDLLAEVADLARVRVRAFVDEPDLGWVRQGQRVEITWDASPGRVWPGTTELVPKTVVARGTRSVGEVLCAVANDNLELLPNINVNVRIRVREQASALVVLRAAVRSEGAERYVFVVEGNTLRKKVIKVGMAGATQYEVLKGLAAGDLVVLPGAVELREGLKVRPVNQQ